MTAFKIAFIVLLGWALLAASPVAAQTHKLTKKELPPSAFKLIAVKVTGTKRYRQEDIFAISGLQIGETVSEDDFKRTARLLGETGAFSNVLYSFEYSPQGTKLELQLTDGEQVVPARFDNFVWFSDKQLMQALRERVPLFDGTLPATGNLADLISDALQSMLIQAGVSGRADYMRSAKEDGPIDAVVFSVTGPDIQVRNISFAGAGESELPQLASAAKQMQRQEYHRALLRTQADKNLLPIYLAKGYLKAGIGDPEAKVVSHNDPQTEVDITFPVDPGSLYKFGQTQWSGNVVFPTPKLDPLVTLHAGDPANAVQLASDLGKVGEIYRTRGYMAAVVKSVPQFDDERKTVSYQLQVQEGDQYHMGDLEIVGLDTRTMDRLVDRWRLQGGNAYDSSYPKRFLAESVNDVLPMAGWAVSIHESLNPKDKTVDVTLRFDPKDPH